MPKITFLGAGSTIFAKNLLTDILSFPELANSTIALHDIDSARLQTSEMVARQMAEKLNAHPTIEASLDRRQSLDGADYAISMYQIGGYKPSTVIDFEIPKKYGLRQTIADTLGIGGIMRGLRTIPVMLDMCRDVITAPRIRTHCAAARCARPRSACARFELAWVAWLERSSRYSSSSTSRSSPGCAPPRRAWAKRCSDSAARSWTGKQPVCTAHHAVSRSTASS
jgi:hypothetical protein